MKKIVVLFAAVAMLFSAVGAANVNIDGESFSGGKLINSVTYVPLRAFCEKVTDCEIAWDNNTRTASVESENLFVSARIENKYLEANERYLYSGNENLGGVAYYSGTDRTTFCRDECDSPSGFGWGSVRG